MLRKYATNIPNALAFTVRSHAFDLKSQTAAILRYVGKLAGLYPEDAAAALKVDCFVEGISDLLNPLSKTYGIAEEEPRLAARKTWQSES